MSSNKLSDQQFFKVAIVGGGPAGSAAAYWLAKSNIEVVVLEKKSYPREKTCGDGLTPRAVKQLVEMQVPLDKLGHKYVGLRAKAFDLTLELPWPKLAGYPEFGYCITRYDLDHLTKTNAESQGALFFENTEVLEVQRSLNKANSLLVKEKTSDKLKIIEFDYLIIADGSNSRIGRQLGIRRDKSYPLGLAIRSYFLSERSHDNFIESHLDIRDENGDVMPGYGWVFPLGDGRVNVGAGLLNTSKRWKGVNTNVLFDRFITQVGPSWGFTSKDIIKAPLGGKLPMGLSLKPRFGSNWLACGDALGSINPFNGEGISYAYETGRLAAKYITKAIVENIRSKDGYFFLSDYNTELLDRYRTYYDVAAKFVDLISNPRLMKIMVRTGMHSQLIMAIVLEIMANLVDQKKQTPSKTILSISEAFVASIK